MGSASDPEVGKKPDVWDLFQKYDRLYFGGALVDAGFELKWTSPRVKTSSCFGSCSFGEMSKTITLYKPMLQRRTEADLKNALLHLMIHAIIFVKHGMKSLSYHGPGFRDWMDAINACSSEDYLRPKGGYCITTTHDFSPEELQSIQGNLWKCESCAATLLRATKLGPPSDSCCIENVSQHATCRNMLCNWHNHKRKCSGKYVVPKQGQKMVPKGYAVGCKRGLLTETSESSKSQDTVQASDSDEFQENCTVSKPKTEDKLLSQVSGRNSKSPGSSYSKKASKSNMLDDFQKAIVPATPRRKLKLKQEFVAPDKHEPSSIGKCNNAKSMVSCSAKKAEDFQKAIVSSASPLNKLKRKQSSVASEKQELRSVESFYNAKSSRSDTSRKASRSHMAEHVQKSNVQPAASLKKPKLEQDMTLSERYGVFSLGSCNKAKLPGSSTSRKASKPEVVEKSSVARANPLKKLKFEEHLFDKHGDTKPLDGSTGNKEGKLHKPEGKLHKPAAPQSILKQPNETNSSTKAEKQHNPENYRGTFFQPAVSQSELRRSNRDAPERQKTRSVAPERQKTRSVAPERKKKRSIAPGKKKEYACISVWANIYESECSSGSAEPLVNKRTERRKRERERAVQITYSRSGKRNAGGISSIKAQPAEGEVSSQQPKPPLQSRCLEFILIDAAVEVVSRGPREQSKAPATHMDIVVVPPSDKVMTQAPRGQSQSPAQCMDIVQPLADLVMTRAHGDPAVQSTCMDIAVVPPADHVMTQAPIHQSQTPIHSAVPPSLTPSYPSSNPDVIDISDDE